MAESEEPEFRAAMNELEATITDEIAIAAFAETCGSRPALTCPR
jgi:hypothetical protein